VMKLPAGDGELPGWTQQAQVSVEGDTVYGQDSGV
jgi:hypothetical protein